MVRFTLDKDRRTERGDRQVPAPLPEISLSGPHQYGATQGIPWACADYLFFVRGGTQICLHPQPSLAYLPCI